MKTNTTEKVSRTESQGKGMKWLNRIIGGLLIGAMATGLGITYGILSDDVKVNSIHSDALDDAVTVSKEGTGFIASDTVLWDDEKIMNTIHGMSHQKVIADEKWMSVEMTQERLESLRMIVENQAEFLDHDSMYIEILDRWIAGDFSNAVNDHNDIWAMQGGSIGKAKKLATPQQERDFVESTFGN